MLTTTRLLTLALLAALALGLGPLWVGGQGFDPTAGATQVDWTTLPLLYLAGLLTAATPCVYPLIPVTVTLFGAGRAQRSRASGAVRSAIYVGGIAATYTALGLVAASTGKAFGSYLQHPAVPLTMAALMTAMALSMFGLFELSLPPSLQQRFGTMRGGPGPAGALLMGLVMGLVAAPCTGPALAGILTFVARTGDRWLGFWLLLTYALGLGTPFFVVGTFAVQPPRGGRVAWLFPVVKSALGIALLLAALSFVRPFLPKPPVVHVRPLWAVAAAVIGAAAAVLLGALHLEFDSARRRLAGEHLRKSVGIVLLLAAASLRFGWLLRVEGPTGRAERTEAPIVWEHDLAAAQARARAEHRLILMDFYADWCSACVELDQRTFTDPSVRAHIRERVIPLKVDGTTDTPEAVALQQRYGVVGMPVVVLVDPEGTPVPAARLVGFVAATQMTAWLERFAPLPTGE